MTALVLIVLGSIVTVMAWIAGYSKGEADATENKFKNLS
jgi:hypothetical protein